MVTCERKGRSALPLNDNTLLFTLLKPRAVCGAFRSCCGGFSRSRGGPWTISHASASAASFFGATMQYDCTTSSRSSASSTRERTMPIHPFTPTYGGEK